MREDDRDYAAEFWAIAMAFTGLGAALAFASVLILYALIWIAT